MTRVLVDLSGGQTIVVDTVERRSFAIGEAIGIDVALEALLII